MLLNMHASSVQFLAIILPRLRASIGVACSQVTHSYALLVDPPTTLVGGQPPAICLRV